MQGTVTPDDVKGLWAHMQAAYGSTIARKDAAEMQAAAELLDRMGITDQDAFLERFSTTIEDRIYIPFEIGEEGEAGRHSLWGQMKVCVHEHQHIAQARRFGLEEYALRYAASPADRAYLEAEAYRCNMELERWRGNRHQRITPYMHSLKHYGLGDTDLDVARSYLTSAAVSVTQGIISTEAGIIAIKWLNANAHHLRSLL